MSTIKNILGNVVAVALMGGAYILSANAAQKLWDDKLEDKFEEKTKKWFSK